MRLISGASTDKGQVREGNEDAYVVDPRLRLFAVADGMGGHQAGEVASATALEALRAAIASGLAVGDGITRANEAVFDKAADDEALSGMGTTITAIIPDGAEITIGHVGDSRAYLLRDGELRQLTVDHSLVEELVREGRITEEQAAVHPQRSIITRALGVERGVQVDVSVVTLRVGDRLLLCSDGLTTMLRPPEIAAILRRETDPTRGANALVDAANAAGGEDNITTVVIDVFDDGPDPLPAGLRTDAVAAVDGADRPAAGAAPDPAEAPPGEPTTTTTTTTTITTTGTGGGTGVADPSPAAAEARPDRPSRRERRTDRHVGRSALRVLWFAVPIVLIVGLGVAAVAWYARRTYFVAFDRGAVVLYQGRPGGLLLWDPTVVRRTDVARADLPEQLQLAIEDRKEFSSRSDALAYVARATSATSTTTTTVTTTTTLAPPTTPATAAATTPPR